MMMRRTILLAALCATGIVWADRPNIVLIMADVLGYETLGTYGSASYETPVLDSLAETGMKFTHCYAQPLCTPSRVKIMTGQYNYRNYTHFGVLPKGEVTFGHLLRDAGYATGVTGKWQLLGHNTDRAQAGGLGQMPDEAGFDEFLLWQITERKNLGERYADPLLHSSETGLLPREGEYGPDLFAQFAERFIASHADEPFFLYFPMALTHGPFVPTPDSDGWDGDRYARDPKHMADMVAYMDKVVGRIVAQLERSGVRENTLLLFTGDNGTERSITSRMTDGRTIKGNKGHPDDAGTRVPLIANWPGVVPDGMMNDNLIDFTDFMPTLISFAEAPSPPDHPFDGVSFAEQLIGNRGDAREWVYCDYNPRWGNHEPTRFARDRRWKLYSDGRFFDVEQDVMEKIALMRKDVSRKTRRVWDRLQAVVDEHATPGAEY